MVKLPISQHSLWAQVYVNSLWSQLYCILVRLYVSLSVWCFVLHSCFVYACNNMHVVVSYTLSWKNDYVKCVELKIIRSINQWNHSCNTKLNREVICSLMCNVHDEKLCKIKGGTQELVVMVGWWQQFDYSNLGEFLVANKCYYFFCHQPTPPTNLGCHLKFHNSSTLSITYKSCVIFIYVSSKLRDFQYYFLGIMDYINNTTNVK